MRTFELQETSKIGTRQIQNLTAIMNFINEAEDRFPVDEWQSHGFHLWPLIRMDLAWSLSLPQTESRALPAFRWMNALRAVASSLIACGLACLRDLKHNAHPHRKADVFFWSCAVSRQAAIEGRKYNIFCDPLISWIEDMGMSWLMWEAADRNVYRIPRFRPSYFVQPYLFWNRLLFRSFGAVQKVEIGKLERFPEFTDFVRRHGVLNFRYLKEDILDQDVRYLRLLANSFRKSLKKIGPSLVVTDNYGIYESALNLAALELGIQTVNIQHGVGGELHFAYGRFRQVPKDGYELLPRIFWCWDQASKEAIDDWIVHSGTDAHGTVLGGNPWLEAWRSETSEFVEEYDRKIRAAFSQKSAKRHILVALQTPEKIYCGNELVSEFVLKAIAESPKDWCWWIRLHPEMAGDKDAVRKLFFQGCFENIEFEIASSFPLPALLRHIDVHATYSSSTVLEAKAFGVPSVVWSEWGAELFSDECKNGFVISAFSSSEFLRAIEKQFENKKTVQPEHSNESMLTLKSLIEQTRSREPVPLGQHMQACETAVKPKDRGKVKSYRQCVRCVLDTTAPDISFDANGFCNYCKTYDVVAAKHVLIDESVKRKNLDRILSEIKSSGRNKKYDCVLGLSGGVDSSYLAYQAKRLDLRPLVAHFDNGWNSEIAVRNVHRIVKKLGFDLDTYVINWDEFKDLQCAYLKASVVDAEVPTDQLIGASLFHIARKKKIKFILDGFNIVTEFIMPKGWNFSQKRDLTNLMNIHRRFGSRPLRNFPKIGFYQNLFYKQLCGIRTASLLNYLPYDRNKAKDVLSRELDWQDYGGKHYESIFTRFYQGYILPKKFNIDKRKAHLSNLICSRQIARKEALAELAKDPYNPEQQLSDKTYVIKKLGFSEAEFEEIMNLPIRSHEEFGSDNDRLKFLRLIYRKLKPLIWRGKPQSFEYVQGEALS